MAFLGGLRCAIKLQITAISLLRTSVEWKEANDHGNYTQIDVEVQKFKVEVETTKNYFGRLIG